MSGWRFLACDLISGEVRGELPMRIAGPCTRLLQQPGHGYLELLPRDRACPPEWETLTLPWRSLFLLVDEAERIAWAGIPRRRKRVSDRQIVELPCVTPEGYFDRRYVPTLDFFDEDQTSVIAATLAGIAGDGFGIALDTDCPPSGRLRERHYHDDEDARVLDRLQQLAAVIDGFEWTVDVEWGDQTRTWVRKVFRTGYPHLGTVVTRPNTVFELDRDAGLGGNIVSYQDDESWAEGDAATHVRAIGDGEGDDRTMSDPIVDTAREAAGWPRLEARRLHSGVTEPATIAAHAGSMAAELFGGQRIYTLDVRADADPRFGTYSLGDGARLQITDPGLLELDVVDRIVGWELRPQETRVRPIVARVTAQQ